MRTKIAIVLLIIIAVALPLLVLRVQDTAAAVQMAQAIASTEYTRVQTGNVLVYIEVPGVIEASATADLSFPVGGQVAEVYVEAGDYVTAGSVLAVLDNDTAVIAYTQATLALNQAEASAYDLQTVDADDITLAEANLNAAWAAYNDVRNQLTAEDRAALEAQYQQALAEAEALSDEASRAPGGYSSPAYETLMAQAGEASFRAEIARLQNEQAAAQNQASANAAYGRVLEAQAELERVRAGVAPDLLEQAELNIQLAEQQVDVLLGDYEDTFLLAPFDGYLSAVNIEVGATAAPGAAVMQITDITPLLLTVRIDETDLGDITPGMAAEVSFASLPGVVLPAALGEIDPLSDTADGIVSYDATLDIDTLPAGVRVGLSADVRLITAETEDVLIVPNGYLREDPATGRVTVQVVGPDGTLIEREVALGLRGVENSEVRSGLQAGDVIALRAAQSSGPVFRPGARFLGGDA